MREWISLRMENLIRLPGSVKILAIRHTQSQRKPPTHLVSMTCSAMFGSGATIGWMWTITDHAKMVWLIRQVHLKGSTVCCAVEGGTATSTTVALRNAAATRPTSLSLLAMACASRGLRKDEAAAFAACEEAIYSFMLRQMQRSPHFHEAS